MDNVRNVTAGTGNGVRQQERRERGPGTGDQEGNKQQREPATGNQGGIRNTFIKAKAGTGTRDRDGERQRKGREPGNRTATGEAEQHLAAQLAGRVLQARPKTTTAGTGNRQSATGVEYGPRS